MERISQCGGKNEEQNRYAIATSLSYSPRTKKNGVFLSGCKSAEILLCPDALAKSWGNLESKKLYTAQLIVTAVLGFCLKGDLFILK